MQNDDNYFVLLFWGVFIAITVGAAVWLSTLL
jgi:hypothetical protein